MGSDLGSAARRPDEGPDEAAFVRLLDEIRPRLLAFVTQRGLGHAAEDVVQDALLGAITAFRRGKFQGRSSPQTWVYGILHHKMADHRRDDGRDALRLISLDAGDSRVASENALGHPASQEITVLVHEVLESMPPRHWLVLMLNQGRQKRTTDEIARILRLSPGRVGGILAEAKRKFREGVKGGEDGCRRKRQTD